MKEAENKPARQSLTLQALAGGNEYELAYLLSPEVAEENLNLETATLQKIISENGGEATESEIPKKRWLAYPIKKQGQASFGVIYFNADKENLNGIKKALSFNKKVLRFLILNKIKPKPIISLRQEPAKDTLESTTPSFEQKLESILKG